MRREAVEATCGCSSTLKVVGSAAAPESGVVDEPGTVASFVPPPFPFCASPVLASSSPAGDLGASHPPKTVTSASAHAAVIDFERVFMLSVNK